MKLEMNRILGIGGEGIVLRKKTKIKGKYVECAFKLSPAKKLKVLRQSQEEVLGVHMTKSDTKRNGSENFLKMLLRSRKKIICPFLAH